MLEFQFFVIAFLFLLVPIGAAIFIYSFAKKRSYPKKYRLLALLPLLVWGYVIFQGILNPYDLGKKHFTEITKFELPATTEFLAYEEWGYGRTPSYNHSLFYVKVESDFYETIKNTLNPSSEKLTKLDEDYAFRFDQMFGENVMEKLDLQFSYYNKDNELIHLIGFFEEEESLLVFYFNEGAF
jgi:hypothetical protein